jgi:sec-independent protein translocase protein TatC
VSPLDQQFGEDAATMSFGEHLDELRKRLVRALIAPVILAIAAFFIADSIIDLLLAPATAALVANGLPPQLQTLDPAEELLTQFKLAIITAFVLSAPWILWQGWKFIQPGLYGHERRFVYFLVPGSAILTMSGLALLYWVMLPLMLNVLIGVSMNDEIILPAPTSIATPATAPALPTFPMLTQHPAEALPGQIWIKMPEQLLCVAVPGAAGEPTHVLSVPLTRGATIVPVYRLREYIDFVLLLALGISIAFQMPLVIVLMGWLGLVEPQDLARYRRHALFFCGVVAAIITPTGDLFSLLLLMGPLYGLYELGLLLLRWVPASRLASGELFPASRFWSSHKDPDRPASIAGSEHSERAVAREDAWTRTTKTDADEECDP